MTDFFHMLEIAVAIAGGAFLMWMAYKIAIRIVVALMSNLDID